MATEITVADLVAYMRLKDTASPAVKAAAKTMVDAANGVGTGWTDAMEKAARASDKAEMKMLRLQEEAIKMNAGFSSTDDKAQLFAGTLDKVSTTATASAAAIGLPIGQLGALNAAADVASLGMGKLTTSAVGFNAASVGVVGAGLAIGGAIGSWLNTFPAVTNAVDKLTFALFGTTKAAAVSAAEQGKLNDQVTKQKDDALKKQLELMKTQGKSWDDIKRFLTDETKGRETALEMVDRQIRAEKERGEAAKAAGRETEARLANEMRKMEEAAAAERKLATDTGVIRVTQLKAQAEAEKDLAEKVALYAKNALFLRKQEQDQLEELQKAEAELADREKAFADAQKERLAKQIEGMRTLAGAILQVAAAVGGMFGTILGLGGAAIQVMANLKDEALQNASVWEKLAGIVAGAMAAFQSGSVMGGAAAGAMAGSAFGIVGAGIGAVAGGLLGWLGKAKKEAAEAKQMLDDFIRSSGGLDALRAAADEAGVSLDALWDAKKPKEMQQAIADVQAQLGLFADAWARVDDAAKRYGLTVADMVPGGEAATRAMDQMFEQIYGDYQLLIAAGYDQKAVLEKMAPAVNEYLAAAQKAGVAIPESMRPMLQQMVDAGLLTDEFGNKLTDLSGITFAESITESVQKIVDAIMALVDALQQGIDGAEGLNQALTNVSGGVGQFTGVPKSAPPPDYTGASGLYIPELPADSLIQAHRGERVEITPASETPARNGRGGGGVTYAPVITNHITSVDPTDVMVDKLLDRFGRNSRGEMERLRQMMENRVM